MLVAVSPGSRDRSALSALTLALSGTCLLFTHPLRAAAIPGLELQVTRSAQAADCPDAAALEARLAAEQRKPIDGPTQLEVRFERVGTVYEARVRASGARSGVRSLRALDATCAPLVEALTVTVLLLLDPQDEDEMAELAPSAELGEGGEAIEGAALPAPKAAAVRPRVLLDEAGAAAPIRRAGRPIELSVSAAPALSIGVTPEFTGGGEFGMSVAQGRFLLALSGAVFAPRSVEFGPGRVSAWLAGGRASACARWPSSESWTLGGCATLLAGRLSVEGQGYSEDSSAVRPLWALGPELLFVQRMLGAWSWFARGAVLVPPNREVFSIAGEGAGEAFRVKAVSGWLGAGLWLKIR
jgi:hypothetical protein